MPITGNIRGCKGTRREDNKQLCSVLKVLAFYSDWTNIQFRSNNQSAELAEVMQFCHDTLSEMLVIDNIIIKRKLK